MNLTVIYVGFVLLRNQRITRMYTVVYTCRRRIVDLYSKGIEEATDI